MEIDNFDVILNDVEHKIFEFKKYLEVVNDEFLSKHLRGKIFYELITYSVLDDGCIPLGCNQKDHYILDLLYSFQKSHKKELYKEIDDIYHLNDLVDNWEKDIIKIYDRTDHIKRFVWSILPYSQVSNNNQNQFFEQIFCLANKHLSPDNPIQFKEFENSGFFCEIVDFRYKQVMIKRLSGLLREFVNYNNNQASISNSGKVVIPGQIYKNGLGNLLVTSIGDGLFDNLTQVETIELPNTIIHAKWSFWNCRKLKDIEVKPCNSEHFCSINGVLFSGDKKTLFSYPNMHGKEYSVPQDVEKIGNCAFKDCILLEELHLPISITHIGINAFYRCENLKKIVCAGSKDCIKVEGSFGTSGKQEIEWIYTK